MIDGHITQDKPAMQANSAWPSLCG